MVRRRSLLAALLVGLGLLAAAPGQARERLRRVFDPEIPRPRYLLEGEVTGIELAPAGYQAGFLRMKDAAGVPYRFRVMRYTLILVRDRYGRLWAGRLDQVKVGWPCSIGYAIPPDPAGDDEVPPAMAADNMIVDARQ